MCGAGGLLYPCCVKSLPARVSLALLGCVLALVMLGVLLRPVLDVATEVHLAGHAVAVAQALPIVGTLADAGCSHDEFLERAHGANHQESSGSVWADLSVELCIPASAFGPVFGSALAVVSIPTRYLATPFKPPIG